MLSSRLRSTVSVLLASLSVLGCEPTTQPEELGTGDRLSERLGGGNLEGFARARSPREFVFPADHGPHPDYRNEWWYLTGNLDAAGGRRFGYQVTFFRIAIAPGGSLAQTRRSGWATSEVWMAHVALSDALHKRHQEQERFARGAAGLAGADTEPFRVWMEDWRLQAVRDGTDEIWHLKIESDGFALDLTLEPSERIVLQGDAGLSQKSAEPGNASYYYSMPRLRTTGTLDAGGERLRVRGHSWLDREWSTSALGADQAGWDWFALQFDDGRDLMYYRLRRTDGQPDPHSAGSLVAPEGSVRRLRPADVALEPQRWWRSADGVRYPVEWTLQLADGPAYRVEAVFDDQRMDTSVDYWEGMVDVFDAGSGEALGRGYLELAGYD